jgi:hypothetical protein
MAVNSTGLGANSTAFINTLSIMVGNVASIMMPEVGFPNAD